MWLHIDIQYTSTGAAHRENAYVVAYNPYLRGTQAQQVRFASFTQHPHGFAKHNRLRTITANPPGYLSLSCNDCLRPWFCRGRPLTPDYCCQNKRLSCLRQSIRKFKKGISHDMLQEKTM